MQLKGLLLRCKLFLKYCFPSSIGFWLPIKPMLEGVDLNTMLGVIEVLRIMLLHSKFFLVSLALHPSNAKGI